MFAPMMAAASGGGSAKSGTTNATSVNEQIAIDTGLTSISKFVWFAMNNNNNAQQIITYDADLGSVFTTAFPATSAGYCKRPIGSAVTSTNPTVVSVSGGTITIKMASGSGYGNCKAGVWYAS